MADEKDTKQKETVEYPPDPRTRGCIRITHELLAILTGISEDSIRFIESDNNQRIIKVFHDDVRFMTWDIPAGGACPEVKVSLARFIKHCANHLKYLGWTVEQPEERKNNEIRNKV